jgi:hypothetical protein
VDSYAQEKDDPRHSKMLSEIYLTRLLSTKVKNFSTKVENKNALQPSDLFEEWSVGRIMKLASLYCTSSIVVVISNHISFIYGCRV